MTDNSNFNKRDPKNCSGNAENKIDNLAYNSQDKLKGNSESFFTRVIRNVSGANIEEIKSLLEADLSLLKRDISRLEEQSENLTKRIKDLEETCKNQDSIISLLQKEVSELKTIAKDSSKRGNNVANRITASDSCSLKDDSTSQTHKIETQRSKPTQMVRTFYATVNLDGDLEEVDVAYKDQVPFVVTIKGDSGEANFNMECVPGCLSTIESDILPFFDYSSSTKGAPARIIPQNSTKVTRKGNAWVMANKIKILIS